MKGLWKNGNVEKFLGIAFFLAESAQVQHTDYRYCRNRDPFQRHLPPSDLDSPDQDVGTAEGHFVPDMLHCPGVPVWIQSHS